MGIDYGRLKSGLAEIMAAIQEDKPTPEPPPPAPDPGNLESITVTNPADLPTLVANVAVSTEFRLTPGLTYPKITLDKKPENVKIVIRPTKDLPEDEKVKTENREWELPQFQRVSRAVEMRPYSHDLTLIGLHLPVPMGEASRFGVVCVGDPEQNTLEEQPCRLIIDRCWIPADPKKGAFRATYVPGRFITIINNRIVDIWMNDVDSQCIGSVTGAGPWHIENNDLSASGEPILFGGGRPIPGVVPTGLVVRRNNVWKKKEWNPIAQNKNLLELKYVQKSLIEYNVFSGAYVDAQAGHGILLTTREGPLHDCTFQYNVVHGCEGHAMQLLGSNDGEAGSPPTDVSKNLKILHNVFLKCRAGIMVNRGWDGLTIANNTVPVLGNGNFMDVGGGYRPRTHHPNGSIAYDPFDPSPEKTLIRGLSILNNIAASGHYGMKGEGTNSGTSMFPTWAPGAVCSGNVFERSPIGHPLDLPAGNAEIAYGALAALLDATYMPRQGTPAEGKGADILKIKAVIPWAFV